MSPGVDLHRLLLYMHIALQVIDPAFAHSLCSLHAIFEGFHESRHERGKVNVGNYLQGRLACWHWIEEVFDDEFRRILGLRDV